MSNMKNSLQPASVIPPQPVPLASAEMAIPISFGRQSLAPLQPKQISAYTLAYSSIAAEIVKVAEASGGKGWENIGEIIIEQEFVIVPSQIKARIIPRK